MLKVKTGVIHTADGTTLYAFGNSGVSIKAFIHHQRKPRIVVQAITREGYLAAEGYVPKVRGIGACIEWLKENTVFTED